jgi:death-on-curing protein
MISAQTAIEIHSILIDEFGGGEGIRDTDLLEAALARPFQTFDNQELYKTTIEKAAALMESLINNHPFIDGNKRTGYVLGRLLLMNDGIDIKASEDEKYDFVISITTGEKEYPQILDWLKEHSR